MEWGQLKFRMVATVNFKITEEKLDAVGQDVEFTLQRVTNESGVMEVNEVGKGKLDKSMLDGNDVFILDASSQIFIWIGNGANKSEKKEAFKYATEYLEKNGRSTRIPMVSVAEGKETSEFWQALAGQACGGRSANAKSWKK